MHKTYIGNFNIELIRLDAIESGFVRLWTDAKVDSPFGHEWLNELTNGDKGIVEIIDIETGEGFVVIELNAKVNTEKRAKKVVGILMQMIDERCVEYAAGDDEDIIDQEVLKDLKQLLAGAGGSYDARIAQALAENSETGTGLVATRYGYADG